MSPCLDQVQNLVSDIWFRLFLVRKNHIVKYTFTFLCPLCFCAVRLNSLIQTVTELNHIDDKKWGGKSLVSNWKKYACHKTVTSPGSWNQCGLQCQCHMTLRIQSNVVIWCNNKANWQIAMISALVGKQQQEKKHCGPYCLFNWWKHCISTFQLYSFVYLTSL